LLFQNKLCFYFIRDQFLYESRTSNYSETALLTTKAQYTTTAEASKEDLWLTRLVRKLDIEQGGIQLHCDSRNDLSNNQVYNAKTKIVKKKNAKTKNINVSFHDIKELLVFGHILLENVLNLEKAGDMLIKPVINDKFKHSSLK